jgi:thymidylate synthase
MKQYLNLLQNIIDNGVEKESGRANMPNTISISFGHIQHDMKEGFPLLTTKKMFWKGIVHELLWFLKGDTNIKYLVDNGVNIWNQDGYRWYLKNCTDLKVINPELDTIEKFVAEIKSRKYLNCNWLDNGYRLGDLGKVYGYQWRHKDNFDQVKDVINNLKSNPYSRYHLINAWDKAHQSEISLLACHVLYQFIVRPLPVICDDLNMTPKFYLDLNMYQRSCDTLLGVPFNLASMALLNIIIAKTCNMIPGKINWLGGDTHIYVNHVEQVKEQLTRTPKDLPLMKINKELNSITDTENLTIEDFELVNYQSYPAIKAELSSGLKK